jgi:hypothetical protein
MEISDKQKQLIIDAGYVPHRIKTGLFVKDTDDKYIYLDFRMQGTTYSKMKHGSYNDPFLAGDQKLLTLVKGLVKEQSTLY